LARRARRGLRPARDRDRGRLDQRRPQAGLTMLRQALRQLGRRAGLSALVIGMLALALGATTAMYSLYYEVLVRPLPVVEPEQLVNLGAPGPKLGSTSA